MSKISTFPTATPKVADLLLGTDIADNSKTKNFTIGSIGALIGSPQYHQATLSSTQLLTLATQSVQLMDPVGVGKSLSVENIYVMSRIGATIYNFAADVGISMQNTNIYNTRAYTLSTTFMNFPIPNVNFSVKLEPTWIGGGVIPNTEPINENGGVWIQGDGAVNPTQGDGTWDIQIQYRVFDTATFTPITS